ncbi:hypothetical protein [Streptomyces sp. NPDC059788]|uniref:hypothetical protein n=1 Tax=Streptomyces sp. NPDC059788 TaxID=3346948 RepID=UPI0036601A31
MACSANPFSSAGTSNYVRPSEVTASAVASPLNRVGTYPHSHSINGPGVTIIPAGPASSAAWAARVIRRS